MTKTLELKFRAVKEYVGIVLASGETIGTIRVDCAV